jgi:hypothetical protein
MTKISRNVYSVAAGEVVRIKVQSVNFVLNVKLDDKLTPVGPVNDFSITGELTMGAADNAFSVNYNFPAPMPAGGKYIETVTGPGGFTDGPSDVLQIGNLPSETLTYVLRLAAVTGAAAATDGTEG